MKLSRAWLLERQRPAVAGGILVLVTQVIVIVSLVRGVFASPLIP